MYAITDQGRAALQQWLAASGEPQKIEYKSLLKLYLSDCADREQLKARIAEMREQALDGIREVLAQVEQFIDGGLALKETATIASQITRMGVRQYRAQLQWLDELEARLAAPPETADIEDFALTQYRSARRELKQLLARHEPANMRNEEGES